MAFYYYTTESIKEIDPDAIPERFIDYFNDLTIEMQEEIRDIHPDLYAHICSLNHDVMDLSVTSEEAFSSDDEQGVIDKWESISIRAWHNYTIYSDVLVCKVIPDGVRRCKIHRKDLIEKQIKYKDKSIFSHRGYLCPECMVLYIEESKIGGIIQNLDKRDHKMWIQPLENTIQEWNEYVEPTELSIDEKVYLPDSWADVDMRCPEDGGVVVPDVYKIMYRDREIRFEAYQCKICQKILMRNSLAQRLNIDCGRIGIPELTFERIKQPIEKSTQKIRSFKPDYFVQNGEKTVYNFDDKKWEPLSEKTTMIVSYSRVCNMDDHDCNDQLVLLRVDEKKGGKKNYLVLVGYCYDCNKYYIAKEDYEILYSAGRPYVTIYDDINSDYYVQSGAVFEEERNHLSEVVGSINNQINSIRNSADYVSPFETGDFADGALAFKKKMSKPLQAQIDYLSEHMDKPYGYRVELMEDNASKVYYLGSSDFEIGGYKIFSFNSDWGREMVNYRNLEISQNGRKLKVKRRRQFDISSAVLYGYIEQSDEDAIFREGLTDPYLVKVLNTRKRQHQLVDIMFTIQENQNAIVDAPINKNIIVQGCAGSGKTVVMLQRLSALKYSNSDFNFERVVILTPNDNFNTHIKGLASSLQLGYVERLPVEKYYEELLLKYSDDFRLKYAISDEMNVSQPYVDYVYSDEFATQFWKAYDKVMDEIEGSYDATITISEHLLDERIYKNCIKISDNKAFVVLNLLKEINNKIEHVLAIGKTTERTKAYEIAFPDIVSENTALFRFLDGAEGYTVKTVYNEVYDEASKEADEILYLRTGKRYLAGTRGTHRYDLYLQLLFAHKFFGYKAGDNTLICIDEGQDLCKNEILLIKSINDQAIFNIFGDTNQLLKYNRGISDWRDVEACLDNTKLYTLNENFRNTNQITQFCNETFKMDVVKTGVDGHRVSEIIRNKLEAMLADLNVNEDRIAILLPRMIKKNSYIDLDQLPMSVRDVIGEQIGSGRICVAYVDEVKGIEFDKVFVVENGMSNNEKYIAYTRALSELTVIFDEELEEKIKEKEEKIETGKNTNNYETKGNDKVLNASKNVRFGKVKSNRKKASEYEDTKIEYTYKCRRCKNTIEMTKKDVVRIRDMGWELPKTCPDCKKELEEIINVGKCKFCNNSIMMSRGKYEHIKNKGLLVLCCDDCVPKLLEVKEKEKNALYRKERCIECKELFKITNGEKDFYTRKGWQLPLRCPKCRGQ